LFNSVGFALELIFFKVRWSRRVCSVFVWYYCTIPACNSYWMILKPKRPCFTNTVGREQPKTKLTYFYDKSNVFCSMLQ